MPDEPASPLQPLLLISTWRPLFEGQFGYDPNSKVFQTFAFTRLASVPWSAAYISANLVYTRLLLTRLH
jgi:hypothetical protein